MVHPWDFVKSLLDRNGALLEFCEVAVGPQWFTLWVLCSRGGTSIVHPWGFVKSRWDPNGTALGFCVVVVQWRI